MFVHSCRNFRLRSREAFHDRLKTTLGDLGNWKFTSCPGLLSKELFSVLLCHFEAAYFQPYPRGQLNKHSGPTELPTVLPVDVISSSFHVLSAIAGQVTMMETEWTFICTLLSSFHSNSDKDSHLSCDRSLVFHMLPVNSLDLSKELESFPVFHPLKLSVPGTLETRPNILGNLHIHLCLALITTYILGKSLWNWQVFGGGG